MNEILAHMIRPENVAEGQVFDISSRTTPARVELSIGFGPPGQGTPRPIRSIRRPG
ncbi:hypothetical protein FLP41_09925 [Paracoccus marcusii]|uniref:hypothetical protein n=1 Tax=Paracoccus marcusii TaxID=59779 RepID=UPI001564DB55|nr:hypothetical protein FLP41_09925 [Paracoccus marcusii]